MVNTAYHESSFPLFPILIRKIHIFELLLLVKDKLDEFEHFCETTMIPRLWIHFQLAYARPIFSSVSLFQKEHGVVTEGENRS